MRTSIWMAAGLLALSLPLTVLAKSWDITLSAPSQAGATLLPPGDYSVKVDTNQALFTNHNTGQKFTVPVKVEQTQSKNDNTELETDQQNGVTVIHQIDLGGRMEQLHFGQ